MGEPGAVDANQRRPGEIATYRWEVSPSQAGTFADPTLPSTTFTASAAGDIVIRIIAGDGLYVAVGECRTRVEPPAPLVVLTADPVEAVVGDDVFLTCVEVGAISVASFEIEQSDGDVVGLVILSAGEAAFTANAAGDLTFTCVGVGADGGRSEPDAVAVVVTEAPDDGGDDGDRPSRG